MFWSATLCASTSPRPSIFSYFSFWFHHPANGDDRHLHAHALMASDISVTWQFLSKRTNVFCYGSPRPYLTSRYIPAQFWHRCTEWSTVWVSKKPLITEEICTGRGLKPGLPNETPALYPLLHKRMLITAYVYIDTRHLSTIRRLRRFRRRRRFRAKRFGGKRRIRSWAAQRAQSRSRDRIRSGESRSS
jgi:hypothetical protein